MRIIRSIIIDGLSKERMTQKDIEYFRIGFWGTIIILAIILVILNTTTNQTFN